MGGSGMTMSYATNPHESLPAGDCEYCEERDGEVVWIEKDGHVQRRVVCRECWNNAKGKLG